MLMVTGPAGPGGAGACSSLFTVDVPSLGSARVR
jgi:hypothetical protein